MLDGEEEIDLAGAADADAFGALVDAHLLQRDDALVRIVARAIYDADVILMRA